MYLVSQQNGLRVVEDHGELDVTRSYPNKTKYTSENCMDHPGTFHERSLLDPPGRPQPPPPQHVQQRMYYSRTICIYTLIITTDLVQKLLLSWWLWHLYLYIQKHLISVLLTPYECSFVILNILLYYHKATNFWGYKISRISQILQHLENINPRNCKIV